MVAVDCVELPGDQRQDGVAEMAADQILQVLAPEVLVAALAALGEGGVVVF